jgi:hypothetical protein
VATPLLVDVAVIGTLALAAGQLRFGVGQLRPRTLERDLVFAPIDLDQHGTGFDGWLSPPAPAAPCHRRGPPPA